MNPARPSWRVVAVDSIVVVALGCVAASSLRESYGGLAWLVAAGGGTAAGLAAAVASARWRLAAWPSALTLLATYLLVGSTLALPAIGDRGRVPSLESLRALLRGSVGAWRDSLTLPTPLGEDGTVLLVPLLIGLISGFVTGILLWRTRHPSLAWTALVGAFLGYAAFGDRLSDLALARGVVLVLGGVVWLRLRAVRHVHGGWARRLALTVLVVSLATGAGMGVSAALDGDQTRSVLREAVQPPFDPRDYASPLSRFRAYIKDQKDQTLITATGLPENARVRIATMDYFDGIVWNVTGGPEDPVASGRFATADRVQDLPNPTVARLTIEDYRGVWVPTAGVVDRIVAIGGAGTGLLLNEATGTAAQVGGVVQGTTYEIALDPVTVPSEEQIAAAVAAGEVARAPESVPERLVVRSTEWVAKGGGDTAGQIALALVAGFREDGYYSNGLDDTAVPSPSGHGSPRLAQLVAPVQMVGDEEQYASAMAVAAQRLGIPARVVIGFVPGGKTTLTGEDVTAWVEVGLADLGWVALDPTPDRDKTLQQRDDDPDPRPQPQVLQPPDQPEEAEDDEPDLPQGAGSVDEETGADGFDVLGLVLTVVKGVGAGALLLSPLWAILLLKSRRRRRRRLDPDPVTRVSGGWRELTDAARDLGVRLSPGVTRYETGRLVVDRFPDSGVHLLAAAADHHVFSGSTPTDEEVAAYWADVDSAVKRMRGAVSPTWRAAHRFSVASVPWRTWLSALGRVADARVRRAVFALRDRRTTSEEA
jgi:hypothetical protein